MKLEVKFFISRVLNVVLFFFVILSIFVLLTDTPYVKGLGDDYLVKQLDHDKKWITYKNGHRRNVVPVDDFVSFDDYIAVRKCYANEEVILNSNEGIKDTTVYSMSFPTEGGDEYYYLICKSTTEVIGPLSYEDFILIASEKGLRVF